MVIDSDGSAFITKPEFDNLKNNFQSQIDSYSQGIDSKIDAAVAAYLAGIVVSRDIRNVYDDYVNIVGSNPVWLQTLNSGIEARSNDVKVTAVFNHCVNNVTNLHTSFGRNCYAASTDTRGTIVVWTTDAPSATTMWPTNYVIQFGSESGARISDKSFTFVVKQTNIGSAAGFLCTEEVNNLVKNDVKSNGSGEGWEWQVFNGRKCLKYYNIKMYYQQCVLAWWHSGFDVNAVDHVTKDNQKGYNPSPKRADSITITKALGKYTKGTKVESGYSAPASQYMEVEGFIQKTNDGKNYLDYIWSLTSDIDIYGNDEEDLPTSSGTLDYTIDDMYYKDKYWDTDAGCKIQKNTVGGGKITWTNFAYKSKTGLKASDFCNNACSTISGEDVKIGGGMLIANNAGNDTKQTFTLTLGLESEDSSTQNVEVKLSKKQFDMGTADASDAIGTYTFVCGTDQDVTFDLDPKEQVWIFLRNITDNKSIEITKCNFKTVV